MSIHDLEEYWQAIDILDAQEVLVSLRVADWPHQKAEARKKWHRELVKMAYPKTFETERVDTKRLAEIIFGGKRGK
jgi:hypothetical protein